MLGSDKVIPTGVHAKVKDFVVPRAHKYADLKVAIPSKRQPSKLRSNESVYSSGTGGNNLMRFNYPRTDFQDFSHSYVEIDLALVSAGNTYLRVSQGINSIIERMKIFLGEREVEDIQSSNLLSTYTNETASNADAAATMLRKTSGAGTQVERNALGAVLSTYKIPLNLGFLRDIGVLPLKFMNDVLRFEFHLADANTCIETDGAAPSFTVTNAIFHTERIEHLPSFEARVVRMLATGIPIKYTTYTHYLANAAGNSKQDVKVPHVGDLIEKVHTFFQDSTTVTNTTVNDKMQTMNKNGLSSIQYEINNRNYPDEPMSGLHNISNDLFQAYLRCFGYWNVDGMTQKEPSVDVDAFNTDRFFMILDLRSAPNEPLISSSTLSADASDLLMKMIWTAPLSNHYIHTFVEHLRVGVLRGKGSSITSPKL